MSPHLATDLRAAAWRGRSGPVAPSEDREDAFQPTAGTEASFRRACFIIAAWLIALLLVPMLFFQPY
ncbi:MAG TPA: hypothetical protein VFV24_07025 [Candidatus Eisenbacteria bacterium]|nr:hypothetical protein [Candidatus Eisenbacteria bacterium]